MLLTDFASEHNANRDARKRAILRSGAVLGAIGISMFGSVALAATSASATPGGGSQNQGTPGDHTDTNGQNDPGANHSASVEHANENADCNARGCDTTPGGGNDDDDDDDATPGGGNDDDDDDDATPGGGNDDDDDEGDDSDDEGDDSDDEGDDDEGDDEGTPDVVIPTPSDPTPAVAQTSSSPTEAVSVLPATTTLAQPISVVSGATSVVRPAAATVAKPAPAKAPKPAAVNGGVVSTASVPTAATVPAAVPAGGGSSAPQTDFPIWGIAMVAAGALAAAGSGLTPAEARQPIAG